MDVAADSRDGDGLSDRVWAAAGLSTFRNISMSSSEAGCKMQGTETPLWDQGSLFL